MAFSLHANPYSQDIRNVKQRRNSFHVGFILSGLSRANGCFFSSRIGAVGYRFPSEYLIDRPMLYVDYQRALDSLNRVGVYHRFLNSSLYVFNYNKFNKFVYPQLLWFLEVGINYNRRLKSVLLNQNMQFNLFAGISVGYRYRGFELWSLGEYDISGVEWITSVGPGIRLNPEVVCFRHLSIDLLIDLCQYFKHTNSTYDDDNGKEHKYRMANTLNLNQLTVGFKF